MRKILPCLVFFLVALSPIGAPAAVPESVADLLRDFRNPPDNARIMVALVVVRSLSREGGTGSEMRAMKKAAWGDPVLWCAVALLKK